jgi:hypothetical protein
MRQREFEYDEILRRALRAAADGIEPAGDGLERIRARLTTPRPLTSAWLMAGYTDVALPALARLWSALDSLRDWLRPAVGRAGQTRAGNRHLRPSQAPGRRPARGTLVHRYGWLRPAAVATAVVIAVAGGFALSQLPGAISNSGAENLPLSNSGTHPHGGSVDSGSASQLPGPSKTSGNWAGLQRTPSASASCGPSAPRRASGAHPTPTPTPSVTPSPTPSATPSPTATPTPTATPSGTPTVTPTSTGAAATTPASPALTPARIVPPADPAATPSPTKKGKPISPAPCEPALSSGRQ